MPRINATETRRRLMQIDALSATRKGHGLEDVVAEMFDLVPGCDLLLRRARDLDLAREFDLGFRIYSPGPWPGFFDGELLIECKNVSEPVGPEQVETFVRKLSVANQRAGVLVAANGVSGSSQDAKGAHAILNDARKHHAVFVAVVTRAELEQLFHTDQLVELIARKLILMKVSGRVWIADRPTLGTLGEARDQQDRAKAPPQRRAHPSLEPAAKPRTALNAQSLTDRELVRSFIPSSAFYQLSGLNNALLVGPRGSGRTTLLRMLTPAPLKLWSEIHGKSLLDNYPLRGIWVASQPKNKQVADRIVEAYIFTLAALRSAVREIAQRCCERSVSAGRQAHAAHEISQFVGVGGDRSPETLEELCDELAHASASMMLEHFRPNNDVDLASAVSHVFHVARDTLNLDDRWCLLFDELELASWTTVAQVFDAMRQADSTWVVKAAVLPMLRSPASDPQVAPLPGHDYMLIKQQGDEQMQFLAELARRYFADDGERAVLTEVLGSTQLGLSASHENAYQLATMLGKRDKGLRDWLNGQAGTDDMVQAAMLRKALPIALGREAARSKRPSTLWTGAEAILRIADGSPRTLLGLLQEMTALGAVDRASISASTQVDAIARAQVMMVNLLRTADVFDLVDRIGQYFRRHLLAEPFPVDPPLTFEVDSAVSDANKMTLETAVNLGAVCPVEGQLGDRATRLRLSFLLAPRYSLPLRLGRPIELSMILKDH